MTTYNIFINSKNRAPNETSNDFNLYFKNQIIVKPTQYINVNVMSFYMMNSMYNVSSKMDNNTFVLEKRNLSTNALVSSMLYTIPEGNYSVLTLRDLLNILLSNVISVSYNYAQNTYTFKKLDATYRYYFTSIKCNKLLGISATTEVTVAGVTGQYVNMVDYQQVLVKSDLEYENLNQDNIADTDTDFNVSQILFWTNKQDVEPFRTISYRNEDAGNSFSYNIVNNNINKISFKLVNEFNEPIPDAPDWLLHLQFTIHDRVEFTMYELARRIIKLLSETNYVLLNILFKK